MAGDRGRMIFTVQAVREDGQTAVTDALTGAQGRGADLASALAALAPQMEARYRELAANSRPWPHEARKLSRLRPFFGGEAG